MKKLKLSEIEVESFVTTTKEEAKTVEGGAFSDYLSLLPGLGGICIVRGVAQVAGETADVTVSIVRSQQQTDCAGATRMIAGCTNQGDICGF